MLPVAELAEIRSCGDGCLNHPFSALLIEDFDCLLHSRVFVNYCPDRFYHRDRMIVMPDVLIHVDSHRGLVDLVVHELEDVALSFEFVTSSDDERHWTPVYNFLKVRLAGVSIYQMSPYLGC